MRKLYDSLVFKKANKEGGREGGREGGKDGNHTDFFFFISIYRKRWRPSRRWSNKAGSRSKTWR